MVYCPWNLDVEVSMGKKKKLTEYEKAAQRITLYYCCECKCILVEWEANWSRRGTTFYNLFTDKKGIHVNEYEDHDSGEEDVVCPACLNYPSAIEVNSKIAYELFIKYGGNNIPVTLDPDEVDTIDTMEDLVEVLL